MHRSRLLVIGTVLMLAGAVGCSDGAGDGGSGDTSDASSDAAADRAGSGDDLSIITYNAGLADDFVDLARERAPQVIDAIADLDADVVFVQEVWTPEDVTTLTDAASDRYGEALFLDPMPSDTELFAYGGSFGIGFLSQMPIVDSDDLVLESSLTRRAVLHVELEDDAGEPVHLFGTHLSAIFTDIPHPGDGTWEQEQADQIATVRAWIDERTAGEGTTVLLGDFNTGPADELVRAEAPENYEALIAGGWVSAYVEADGADARCTYCDDNPLVEAEGDPDGGGDGTGGVLIDHVLVLDPAGPLDAERILDREITVEVGDAEETTALSDHYGVRATVPTG